MKNNLSALDFRRADFQELSGRGPEQDSLGGPA